MESESVCPGQVPLPMRKIRDMVPFLGDCMGAISVSIVLFRELFNFGAQTVLIQRDR